MAGELDQSVISNGVTFMKYLSGERIKKNGEDRDVECSYHVYEATFGSSCKMTVRIGGSGSQEELG